MKSCLKITLLLIGLLFFVITPVLAQESSIPRVLVLHSYHKSLSWVESIENGIIAEFKKKKFNVALRFEYMDTKRITDPNYSQVLYDLYQYKFKNTQFDVIICTDNNALNFLLSHRNKLFPDTPVVFCGINNFNDAMIEGKKLFTGTVEGFSFKETLDVAIKLHPGTKQIVFYGDNSPTYLANKALLEQIADEYKLDLEFFFKDNSNIKQIQDHIRHLNQDAIILIGSTIRDEAGRLLSFEQSVEMMEKVSCVPIYGCWDFYLGHGIVGGKLINGFSQGKIAAEIAIQILSGKEVAAIPVIKKSPNQYMFDNDQLKKFSIDISSLPKNSVIINKRLSFYAKNRSLIISVIGIITVLAFVILILSFNIRSRKRSEKKLIKSEEKYRSIFENVVEGFFQSTPEGRFINVNPAFATMFGYASSEEFISSISNIAKQFYVNAEDRRQYKQHLMKSGYIENFEFRAQCKNGSHIWVSDSTRAIYDHNDKIIRYEGNVTDITERKRAVRDLEKEKFLFKTIIDKIPVLLTRYDPDTEILYLNKKFEEVVGWKTEDLKDIDLMEKVYPDPDYRQQALEYMQKSTTDWKEFIIQSKFGENINSEWSNIQLEDGTQIGIGIDVTNRKQAEKEIKNHNENLKVIFNGTPNILVLVNDESRVEMINNSGAAFLGKRKEDLLGLLGGEVFSCLNSFDGEGCGRNPDCSQCPVRTRIMSTFQTGKPHSGEEGRMTFLLNDEEISMDLLISTTLLKLNGASKVLLSLTDITKQKKVENELKRRSAIEAALTKISNLFVSSNQVDYNRILQIIGEKVIADRTYIFQIQEDGSKLSNTFEWCAHGTSPQIDVLQNLETSIFPWWMTEMMEKRNIIIKNVDELPPEANAEKEILQELQIYSLIVIPIWLEGKTFWGFLGFDDTKKTRDWSDTEIDALKIAGEMISGDLARKASENKREVEREQFLSIFENIDEVIYVSDVDTYEILYVNHTLRKAFPKELIGKTCYQALQGLESPCGFCTNDIILKQKPEPYSWEYHNPVLNRDFNIIDRIIKWPDGRNVRFEFARDITDRKQDEIATKKSEQKFRELFNSITDLIYTRDMDGRLTSTNPAMQKLFGYDEKEFLGRRETDFMEPEFQSNVGSRNLDVIKKQGYLEGIDCYLKKNGEKLYIDYKSFLVKPVDGEPYISGVARDVTEKIISEAKVKKLQEQVIQSQKMESIGTLAGGIAHDFNNILFPILGHSEMLLEDLSNEDHSKASVKEIYSGALRAKELVQQILTFSRQEKNEMKLMKIQPILKEALKMIRSTVPTTIDILQDIEAKCGAIKADPTQIHQIIMNLTTNAYHAMEENGGTIKIRLKQIELKKLDLINSNMEPGTYACLTVKDTGPGMAKKLIEKIFDPFFTTKENGKGTGMGLSVVHGIVNGMRGVIQVYSEPGKGTEFHVYFPLETSVFGNDDFHPETKIQGGKEQILLVDDEKAILTMEKQMLERLGYQVTSRTSSVEALEAFRDNPDKFDLIITDMAMPNLPGDKLAVELTKIRPDIPVLLCTGFSETMSEEKATSLGINGFLLKPIVMKDLSKKIREVLDMN